MHKNTGRSGCGGGNGSGGGNGATKGSSSLKKQQQKCPRVPKRGPGFPMLDLIMKEQGRTTIDNKKENLSNEPNPVWPYSAKRNNHYPPPMMAGLKRCPFSPLDNSLIPPSNFQVPPSFSHRNKPQQSSTNDSHAARGSNSRDAKWGSTLELSSRRFNSDIGRQLDKMKGSFQHSGSCGPDHKPFYNFLMVKSPEEVTETTHGPNRGGCDAGRGSEQSYTTSCICTGLSNRSSTEFACEGKGR